MKKTLLLAALAGVMACPSPAVESIPGIRGNAVSIDGRRSYLIDNSRKPFDYRNGCTVSVCFRAREWAQGSAIVSNAGSFNFSKRLKNNRGFYMTGTVNKKRKSALIWSPEKFPAFIGKWYVMAFTYDPVKGLGKGYVNGTKVAEYDTAKALGNPKNLALSGTMLGNTCFMLGNGSVPYNGDLDEVVIYGRVLSDSEIKEVAFGRFPAGAQALYTFDDPDHIGKDSSGNNRHLSIGKGFLADKPPRIGSVIATDYLYKQPGLTVWSRPASEKNMPGDKPQAKKLMSSVSAQLAANEYESFQISVSPDQELKDLKLELSDFVCGKNKLPARIFTVRYVAISEVSQTAIKRKTTDIFGEAATSFDIVTAKPGYYPDVLPEGNRFDVAPAKESSAFWITVKSSKDQQPGIYRATARLTAGNGLKVTFPVTVEVWNFALPEEKHTRNSGVARDALGKDSEALYKNLAEHYVSITPLRGKVKVTLDENDKISVDTSSFDREAALAIDKYKLNVLYFPGWDFYNMPKAAVSGATWNGVQIQHKGHLTERFKKVFGEYLRIMSAHLEKKGYLRYARITLLDEPWTAQDFNLCQEFSQLIRKNAPKVEIMVTKWPQPGLFGAPDVWCLGFFQPQRMKEALKRGERLEFYPNWHVFIDRPLMDSRMLGFLMWKYQITGILFWKLNHGWSNPKNLEAPRFVYPDGRVVCGSGLLIYPDKQNNPVSSIRWEMMRDAFEDFEYFYLLNTLIKKHANSPEAKEAQAFIKKACDAIVPQYEAYLETEGYGWKKTKWEFDAAKLRNYRRELAQHIIKLQAK